MGPENNRDFFHNRPFPGRAGVGYDACMADRFDRTKSRGFMGNLQIILLRIHLKRSRRSLA
jgi:hypothetical protein